MKVHETCPNCGWDLKGKDEYIDEAETSGEIDPLLVPLGDRIEFLTPKKKREKDERKYKRVRVTFKGCIKIGDHEEVVDVQDVSKQGLRFSSPNLYQPGTLVQYAAPYTVGGINIFAPAKIVRSIRCPSDFALGDYALELLP